jgi:PKD repeat protein
MTYQLTVTDSLGCKNKDDIFIELESNPIADLYHIDSAYVGQEVTVNNYSVNAIAYNWNFGNGESSADFVGYVTYQQAGNYTIELISFNGFCSDTVSSDIVVVEQPETDIKNIKKDILIEYDQNNKIIYVRTTGNEQTDIQLLSANGKILAVLNNNGSNNYSISVNYLEPGVYLVKTKSVNSSEIQKIVIK